MQFLALNQNVGSSFCYPLGVAVQDYPYHWVNDEHFKDFFKHYKGDTKEVSDNENFSFSARIK